MNDPKAVYLTKDCDCRFKKFIDSFYIIYVKTTVVQLKWTLSTRQNKVEFKVATRRLFMPLPVAAL